MPTDVLTMTDACHLAEIVRAAQGKKRIARVFDEGDSDNIIYGTARSIGDERGNFAGRKDDIRNCFLRVTSTAGWEHFWPVRDLISEIENGHFYVDVDFPER